MSAYVLARRRAAVLVVAANELRAVSRRCCRRSPIAPVIGWLPGASGANAVRGVQARAIPRNTPPTSARCNGRHHPRSSEPATSVPRERRERSTTCADSADLLRTLAPGRCQLRWRLRHTGGVEGREPDYALGVALGQLCDVRVLTTSDETPQAGWQRRLEPLSPCERLTQARLALRRRIPPWEVAWPPRCSSGRRRGTGAALVRARLAEA